MMTLREQVEQVFPGWKRWYPSLFDAATDLGLIRAEVCSPDSLLLSKRHAKVRQAAEDAHREKWGGGPPEDPPHRETWEERPPARDRDQDA